MLAAPRAGYIFKPNKNVFHLTNLNKKNFQKAMGSSQHQLVNIPNCQGKRKDSGKNIAALNTQKVNKSSMYQRSSTSLKELDSSEEIKLQDKGKQLEKLDENEDELIQEYSSLTSFQEEQDSYSVIMQTRKSSHHSKKGSNQQLEKKMNSNDNY